MAFLIQHMLIESAQRAPEAPAVWHGDGWTSYGELERASNCLAASLVEQGIARGDRVAILCENSVAYVIAYYAILKAGGVVVALNTETTADMLARLLSHCGARAIVVSKKYFRFLFPALVQAPLVQVVIADAEIPVAVASTFDRRWSLLDQCTVGDGSRAPACAAIDIDCSSIVYTSGSTGEPKGVMLSHLNTVANTRSIVEYLRLTASDRIMVVLPFYYVYGKTLLNTHVMAGGSVVIDNRFMYPNVVLQTMREQRVTGFAGVPSTFMILLNKSTVREMTFPDLRYLTQAGGAMAATVQKEVAQVFAPSQLYIMYGATELAPRLTWVPPDRLAQKWGSIGIPIPNTEAFVVDDQDRRLGPGIEGEIVGRGSNVMMGYWNDSQATAQVLRNGMYHTGDVGVVDEDGFLFVVGRLTDMIKIGGNRVSAKEIEEALLALPGVAEAAVIGASDPVLGETAVAFVVRKADRDDASEQIREQLSARLPMYKVPKTVVFIEALPKNESGKVMKRRLTELLPTSQGGLRS